MTDSPPNLDKLKIFADGAALAPMLELAKNPRISGFTTNPTLMRKAGISDYRAFARDVLAEIRDKPISFEVFADEFPEMKRQALEIATWGANVYVKIPITNTKRETATPLIRELASAGVKLNVTAICTLDQVRDTAQALRGGAPSVVSVFAGRIADTGRDPIPLMREALGICRAADDKRGSGAPSIELLWASPRELLNIIQAAEIGCDIITVTNDVLAKLPTVGKDLAQFSLETVQMFYRDAQAAGFKL
jgi:transaldolase